MNRKYGKLYDGAITYAPDTLTIDGIVHHNPSTAAYNAQGWLTIHDEPPTPPTGYHNVPSGWEERDGAIYRTYTQEADPVVPRKWSRLSLKTAIANKGWLPQMKTILGGIAIATDYSAWEALTDCDYIEEFWPTEAQWNATLDGVAAAIGKTRAEIDAFLGTVQTEVA